MGGFAQNADLDQEQYAHDKLKAQRATCDDGRKTIRGLRTRRPNVRYPIVQPLRVDDGCVTEMKSPGQRGPGLSQCVMRIVTRLFRRIAQRVSTFTRS